MGWETRGRRRYFYTAERVGGRVVKWYAVTGSAADLAARLAAVSRERAKADRSARQAQQQATTELVTHLDRLHFLAELVAEAALAAAGCHEHRGAWRKQRARPD